MTLTVHPAGDEHLSAIESIERESFSLPWTYEQFAGFLDDEHHAMFVALDEEKQVVGFLCLMHVLDEGEIANIAVAPAYRKQGAADALMMRAMSFAEEHGLVYMGLEVRESNVPAISLYQKYGFQITGKRKAYYDAPKEDALIMVKKWETRQRM